MSKRIYLFHLIENLSEHFYRLHIEILNKINYKDLSPSHLDILYLLVRNNTLSMKELAEGIRRDKSTITALVRKLEQINLVSRIPDEKDKRVVFLTLTPTGKKLKRLLITSYERMHRTAGAGLTINQQNQLFELLESLLSNLEQNNLKKTN